MRVILSQAGGRSSKVCPVCAHHDHSNGHPTHRLSDPDTGTVHVGIETNPTEACRAKLTRSQAIAHPFPRTGSRSLSHIIRVFRDACTHLSRAFTRHLPTLPFLWKQFCRIAAWFRFYLMLVVPLCVTKLRRGTPDDLQ
jgi:hypothetical protein